MKHRWRRILPGLWAGLLLCIAVIATPAVFAALPAADAGRVVARIFVQEAWLSLALAGILLMLERSDASPARAPADRSAFGNVALLWGTAACTVLGYFVVQWLMHAARTGQGMLSFGQLHLASTVFYGLKTILVLVLAWRSAV
jgi:hypothetical protein